jgi:hypothetical protein
MVFAQLLSSDMTGQLVGVAVGLYGVLVTDEGIHSREDQDEAVSGVHSFSPSISASVARTMLLMCVPLIAHSVLRMSTGCGHINHSALHPVRRQRVIRFALEGIAVPSHHRWTA